MTSTASGLLGRAGGRMLWKKASKCRGVLCQKFLSVTSTTFWIHKPCDSESFFPKHLFQLHSCCSVGIVLYSGRQRSFRPNACFMAAIPKRPLRGLLEAFEARKFGCGMPRALQLCFTWAGAYMGRRQSCALFFRSPKLRRTPLPPAEGGADFGRLKPRAT